MPVGKRSNPVHDTPPKTSEKRTKENDPTICQVCCATITESSEGVVGEDAVFCEGDCKAWIHRKCLGMSILVYDKLSKCKDPYMCPHCTIFKQSNEITKLRNQVIDLTSELASMKTLEQKVIDLEQKLSSVNEPSSSSTSDSTAALPSLQPNHTNTADDHISNIVSSYISEEKEKAKRRLNLIVHNLEESSSENGAARQKDDIDRITSIIQKHVEATPHISKAIRLGKRQENQEKARLLKITVSSEAEKAIILRNVLKLRKQENPEAIKNIYISPDMTPKEQEANKKLRLELKKLNKDGNQYQIKNGRIVQRRNQH